MPSQCVETDLGSAGEAEAPFVALVWEQGSEEDEMVAVLAAAGIESTRFEGVDELLAGAGSEPPCQVVLRVEAGTRLPAEVARLRKGLEDAQVILVCAEEPRGWEVRAALEAGVAGIVLESDVGRALEPCLAAARAGQVSVPMRHGLRIDPPALSAREKQILGLVVMGQTNGQIAERLVLAESTVKSHLSSAFGKLGVRSRHEAVDLILDAEHGLGMGILGLGGEPLQAPLAAAG